MTRERSSATEPPHVRRHQAPPWTSRWSSWLIAAVSLLLVGGAAHAQTIGWWKFDELPPGAVATEPGSIFDYALGNHGTPVGGPVYAAAARLCATQGLRFDPDGSGAQRVFIPDRPEYEALLNMTVEAIIATPGYRGSSFNQIVFRGDDQDSQDPFFLTLLPDNTVALFVYNVLVVQTSQAIPLDAPVHIAATLDDASSEASIYIDRVLDTTAAVDPMLRPNGALVPELAPGLGIANLQSDVLDQYFHGTIYEVRLSNVALPASQMLPGLAARATADRNGVVCPTAATVVSAGASPGTGADPSAYQWQVADAAAPGGWRNLSSGLNALPPPLPSGTFIAENTATSMLRIRTLYGGNFSAFPGLATPIRFRCSLSNLCGSAISSPATLVLCKADLNCSGDVSVQDIFDFLNAYFSGGTIGDFNGVGGATVQDIFDFLAAYFAGC